MKIAIVLGTRPEIIKLSSIIRELEQRSADYFIIHTGQHYSYEMDKVFFEELALPQPKYNLDVGSGHHGAQTAHMLEKIELILIEERPDVVLVQGDTNSVLAGALAAVKLQIKVGHVEAGLRSYDRTMPEETNRIITDHISEYLFCPTEDAKQLLRKEGIDEQKIFVTGNTVVDAVLQSIPLAQQRPRIVQEREYFLITAHRPANVDTKEKLETLFRGLDLLYAEHHMPIMYPIHPRTKKMVEQHQITMPACITLLPPAGFLDFLQLERNAKLILTDSGGVQEEACILHVPCVTLRENTERPETVSVGANTLVGIDEHRMLAGAKKMLSVAPTWKNPFGDGTAGKQIIDILEDDA